VNNRIVKVIANNKKRIKKLLPVGMLRMAKKVYLNHLMKQYKKEPIDENVVRQMEPGINLIGDIAAEIGLGQSMRLVANELELSRYPFGIYDFWLEGNVRRGDHTFAHRIRTDYPYRINLFHINFQEIGLAYLYLDKNIWKNHYNIAFWLWEIEEFPKEHLAAIRFFDEIWTPSEFASNSIRKVTDKPVHTIPYYVLADQDASCDRAYFGLPENQFLYLIMYDTNSTSARKNPIGALEAYQKAFPVEKENIGLVIKMNNPTEKDIAAIREQTKGYHNIYFITEILDKPKVNSLIAAVDVFVSLHRAEGFGLVMAEAMLLKTACVATNWSSNTEFMNAECACMVSYEKTKIQETAGNYKKGYQWAEPDVKEAAAYMRRLYEDEAYYSTLVEHAKESVQVTLGKERIVSMLENRVEEINGLLCVDR
jgi:glycosyltransferase involved in cell wall biosynthesis